VCALRGGEALHEALIPAPRGGRPLHASALLPEVERAAEAVGGWQHVQLISAGTGPGSFTGLRIGISTAKALAAALELPAAGVSTLDALARGMGDRAIPDAEYVAVLDARRGEVFAALYADGKRVWGPLVCGPADLAARLGERPGPVLAAGSGAVRFRDELAGGGVEIPEDSDPVHRIAARHTCVLGAAVAGRETGSLDPIYLRSPDAERWRERDSADRTGI
jgi:tRNA threonylcarbamoyladenosine biosynthesis protein TsaB